MFELWWRCVDIYVCKRRCVARNLFWRGQKSGLRHQQGPGVWGEAPKTRKICWKFYWMSHISCCSAWQFRRGHVPLVPPSPCLCVNSCLCFEWASEPINALAQSPILTVEILKSWWYGNATKTKKHAVLYVFNISLLNSNWVLCVNSESSHVCYMVICVSMFLC